jgi:hypothetical protein
MLSPWNPHRGLGADDGLGQAIRECWDADHWIPLVLRLSGGYGAGIASFLLVYGGVARWLTPLPLTAWFTAVALVVRLSPRAARHAWERACIAMKRCPACFYPLVGGDEGSLASCPECGHAWSLAPRPEPTPSPVRSFRLYPTNRRQR